MAQEQRALTFLENLPDPWRLGAGSTAQALPLIQAALDAGWAERALLANLGGSDHGIRDRQRTLLARIRNLPAPAKAPAEIPACPDHPGSGRRATDQGSECAACWTDRVAIDTR